MSAWPPLLVSALMQPLLTGMTLAPTWLILFKCESAAASPPLRPRLSVTQRRRRTRAGRPCVPTPHALAACSVISPQLCLILLAVLALPLPPWRLPKTCAALAARAKPISPWCRLNVSGSSTAMRYNIFTTTSKSAYLLCTKRRKPYNQQYLSPRCVVTTSTSSECF